MAYVNMMDVHLNRQQHLCNTPMSHILQQQESVRKIKGRFLVIKEVPCGVDAMTVLCISKDDIYTTLENPKGAAYFPEQNMRALQWLNSLAVIIKHPKCAELESQFHKEIQATVAAGSVKGTIGYRSVDYGRFPNIEMRWLRGGSMRDHFVALRSRSKPMPAGMIWHIAVSLLETVKGLRNGYPNCKPDDAPILHGDIHLGNIMVDASNGSFPPYPDIVLIDFGRGKVGSNGPYKPPLDSTALKMNVDLMAIGDALHILAHQGHLQGCLIKSWEFWPLHDGKCTCMQQEEDAPFGDEDGYFAELIDSLCGPVAMDMNDAGLDKLLEVARRCREEQAQNSYGKLENRVFEPISCDATSALLSCEEIARAMRVAYEGGELRE